MRLTVSVIGTCVSLGLIIVSLVMNFRFGQMLGKTEFDGLVYGSVSACADGFKVILPFTTVWAWKNARYPVAFVSACLFLLFTSYSIASSLGFSATNRAEMSGNRIKTVTEYQDLKDTSQKVQAQRKAMPVFRPVAMLQALLKAKEQHIRWDMTKHCTDATLPESRIFCDGYFQLVAEQGTAKQAEQLDQTIENLQKQLQSFDGGTVLQQKTIPQVQILKEISGLAQSRVEMALTIILTLLVELGSGFGLFVTFGHGVGESDSDEKNLSSSYLDRKSGKDQRSKPPDIISIETWVSERLIRDPSAQTPLSDLYRDYCDWCRKQGHDEIMTLSKFSSGLAELGFTETTRLKGRVCYVGVRVPENEN